MLELGLKLWSINVDLIPLARALHEEGVYAYIELYAVPESLHHAAAWRQAPIPFVVHAPHSGHGVNLARADCAERNTTLLNDARRYADALKADRIVLHPGVGGDIRETARQLRALAEPRLVIENKPYYSVYDHSVCNGYSPEDIQLVMEEAGAGFCLDIAHAVFAANGVKTDRVEWVKRFAGMRPAMFHVSDGEYEGIEDRHLSLGRGSFPFDELVQFVPADAVVTLETEKDEGLRLFQNDVRFLRRALGAA